MILNLTDAEVALVRMLVTDWATADHEETEINAARSVLGKCQAVASSEKTPAKSRKSDAPHSYSVRLKRTGVTHEDWNVTSDKPLDWEAIEGVILYAEQIDGVDTFMEDREEDSDSEEITEIIDDETGDEV